MKFCEKLQKLRKEKGYSQEELADLLEVSRQSVSKWESGTTYPEMDKLLSLCKIFNVSLDDLTNDEVSTNNIKEKNKNNFSNLIYTILDMINKSIEMFKSMNHKEIVKCLTELIIVFLLLLFLQIPFSMINNSIADIFYNFPPKTFNLLNSIWLFISNTIYLVLIMAIFIYIYKSRYLDKFDPSQKKKEIKEESNNDQVVESNIKEVKVSKEKHSFIIFDCLGAIFNAFIKVCLFFVSIPTIIVFVMLIIMCFVIFFLEFSGIHFFGILIGFLGATASCYVIMEIFIRGLFSSEFNFKRLFITFLIGLIAIGAGIGISLFEFSNIKYYDIIPINNQIHTEDIVIPMHDNLIIGSEYWRYNYNNLEYEIDETLTNDVVFTLSYYSDYNHLNLSQNEKYVNIYAYTDFEQGMNLLNLIKNNLKEQLFYNYELLYDTKIIIKTSSKNINKLKENAQREKERHLTEIIENNYYQERINELEIELENKNDSINELEEKINELNTKLENIQNQF